MNPQTGKEKSLEFLTHALAEVSPPALPILPAAISAHGHADSGCVAARRQPPMIHRSNPSTRAASRVAMGPGTRPNARLSVSAATDSRVWLPESRIGAVLRAAGWVAMGPGTRLSARLSDRGRVSRAAG